MTERINKYKSYIDSLIKTMNPDTDWDEVIAQHLIQLNFFMHERLIHLIVTVLFALIGFIVLGLVLITDTNIMLLVLFLLILVLLIPYIKHYYLLENSVQYMYKQYDELLSIIGKKAFKLNN